MLYFARGFVIQLLCCGGWAIRGVPAPFTSTQTAKLKPKASSSRGPSALLLLPVFIRVLGWIATGAVTKPGHPIRGKKRTYEVAKLLFAQQRQYKANYGD